MYCSNCGKLLEGSPEYCSNCGTKQQRSPTNISPKSRLAMTLLSFFLGWLGIHRFYAGKIGTAVTMLVLSVVGILTYVGAFIFLFVNVGFYSHRAEPGVAFFVTIIPAAILLATTHIWGFVDFILSVAGVFKDKEGKVISKWQ